MATLAKPATESAKPRFSVITVHAGGAKGTLSASKSYREQREPRFRIRTSCVLGNCQATALPYNGTNARSATRVYLKPHYLPPVPRLAPAGSCPDLSGTWASEPCFAVSVRASVAVSPRDHPAIR